MKKKVVKEEIYMAISAQAKLKECMSIISNADSLFHGSAEVDLLLAKAYGQIKKAVKEIQETYEVEE